MIRRAVLTTPAAGDPAARVAGLPVLLRQLLSLQDAGIEEVGVQGLDPATVADPRLRIPVRPLDPAVPPPTGPDQLRAPVGLVWHRLLPQRLVRSGWSGAIPDAPLLPGEFVVPVRDDATRRRAETLLLGSLLKSTDGFVSRHLNRPISLRITRALLDTDFSPNQMTLLAAAFGFLGIAVVALGGMGWLVAGAVLLQVQSILDGCDGELSRLKYIRSRLGEWLDQVLDDVINLGFFVATGWALVRSGSTIALVVTVTGATLHLIYQIALYAALVLRGGGSGSVTSIQWWGQAEPEPAGVGRRAGLLTTVKEAIEMAGRRDFFVFLYLPTALLGVVQIALGWSAIIFVVSGITTGLQWLLRGGPEPARPTA